MMQKRRRKRQSGQAIVIVGAMIIALTILGTMVFDVGLAMSDRRNLQAYADAAALAGSRSFGPAGPAKANYVALQYLAPSLGFTVPVGACGGPTICPAGTYYVAGYTIQLADRYRVNGILGSSTTRACSTFCCSTSSRASSRAWSATRWLIPARQRVR